MIKRQRPDNDRIAKALDYLIQSAMVMLDIAVD
jgi:hypothetical protein